MYALGKISYQKATRTNETIYIQIPGLPFQISSTFFKIINIIFDNGVVHNYYNKYYENAGGNEKFWHELFSEQHLRILFRFLEQIKYEQGIIRFLHYQSGTESDYTWQNLKFFISLFK